MIDQSVQIPRVIESLNIARPIVAAGFDLDYSVCERLVREQMISGFIMQRGNSLLNERQGNCGAWIDRENGRWTITNAPSKTIVFFGSPIQIGTHMMLTAARRGIRQIIVTAPIEGTTCRLNLKRELARAGFQRLAVTLARFRSSRPAVNRLVGTLTPLSFESAFTEFMAAAEPVFARQRNGYHAGHVSLIVGSLGPGGAERQVAMTSSGLAKGGIWRPTVTCSNLSGENAAFYAEPLRKAGVQIEEVPLTPARMGSPEAVALMDVAMKYRGIGFHNVAHIILSYAYYFQETKPQLVQCWMDFCNVLAGLGAHLAGVPSLVISGRSVAPDNFSLFQPYMKPGYKLLLALEPNLVFTNNSQIGATDYARWLGLDETRFTVLPNGFDFPPRPSVERIAALKTSLGADEDTLIVGGLLRFSEEKRPDLWVEMAEELVRQHPSALCVAFGHGPMLEPLRAKIAAAGLSHKIKLPGITDDAWTSLSMMDVFVLTSRMEGLPNVVVEAQSMGVPVVTTGVGGTKEAYSDCETGLTAKTASAKELSDLVSRLLRDSDLRETMGRKAQAFALQNFASSTMIDRTLAVFDRAITA